MNLIRSDNRGRIVKYIRWEIGHRALASNGDYFRMIEGGDDERVVHPPGDYQLIRDILLGKTPTDIRHELPNLVEMITEYSQSNTIRFIIGVSFSTNDTCFDFWIDRIFDPVGEEGHRVEELKPPVNPNDAYLTVVYPPDREFNAAALRGCLLSRVEQHLAHEDGGQQSDSARQTRFMEFFNRVRGIMGK